MGLISLQSGRTKTSSLPILPKLLALTEYRDDLWIYRKFGNFLEVFMIIIYYKENIQIQTKQKMIHESYILGGSQAAKTLVT